MSPFRWSPIFVVNSKEISTSERWFIWVRTRGFLWNPSVVVGNWIYQFLYRLLNGDFFVSHYERTSHLILSMFCRTNVLKVVLKLFLADNAAVCGWVGCIDLCCLAIFAGPLGLWWFESYWKAFRGLKGIFYRCLSRIARFVEGKFSHGPVKSTLFWERKNLGRILSDSE